MRIISLEGIEAAQEFLQIWQKPDESLCSEEMRFLSNNVHKDGVLIVDGVFERKGLICVTVGV